MKKVLKKVAISALSIMFILLNITGIKAVSFSPRLSAPSTSDYHYYSGNIFYQSGYGMPNCTAYAWGRAYEILGYKPNLSTGNANQWYNYNLNSKAFGYGSVPKVGSIMCWNGGYGHVAVVEKVEGNKITISESSYGGFNFRTKTDTVSRTQSYNSGFQGYIYLGNFDSKPGKPSLNVKASDSNSNVVFSWNNAGNTHHFDLRIFKSGSSNEILYKKDITSTSFSYKLPAGNYYANVASVGTDRNNYTFSDNVSFTVKSAIPQPGKPTLKVVPGTASYKTTFNWNTTTNTDYYSIRIYKSGSTSEYKLITNIKGNSYSLVLPAGNYYAKVNSSNSTHKTYTFSDNVNFSVMKTPTKSSDGWYYVDKLPSYVNGSNYTIQYKNVTEKVTSSSPGNGYVKGALVKSQYENKGGTYWSKIELPTSNTRVLVSYYYYHYCGANAGNLGNYKISGNYVHEDTITDVNSVIIANTVADGKYTGYWLKWKNNGAWAYCCSGVTCNGTNGTHGNRSYGWYRNSQYQDKKLVNYYKYTKTSGWVNSKDSSATTVKYRFKPKTQTKIAISKATVTIKNASYTGKQIKPAVTVRYSGNTLKNGTDYTLSYGTNKSTGKAIVKITGKGKYTGSVTKTFYIVPKAPGGLKVSIGKKNATVKYSKSTGASGYQISYRIKGIATWKNISLTGLSKKITKLTSRKTYEFKVRAYKTVGKTKYYGSYSQVKSGKIK